jgi:hypothetical protein
MVKMIMINELMYLLTILITGTGELRALGFLTRHLGLVHSRQTLFGVVYSSASRRSWFASFPPFSRND